MNFIAWGVKFELSTLIHCSMAARPWRSFGTRFPPALSLM